MASWCRSARPIRLHRRGTEALDKWVRDNTIDRFGPVREVEPGLVLEVAFDSVHRSTRHKSGVAMRFPAHQPHPLGQAAAEADRLETLEKLIVE